MTLWCALCARIIHTDFEKYLEIERREGSIFLHDTRKGDCADQWKEEYETIT